MPWSSLYFRLFVTLWRHPHATSGTPPRSLFYRTAALGVAALLNRAGSCLFRHEVAYVLGQMRAKTAVPALLEVLADAGDDPIVRHEVRRAAQEGIAPQFSDGVKRK